MNWAVEVQGRLASLAGAGAGRSGWEWDNGKVLIGSALNLKGILNSNRFQLDLGSHRNKRLQADWKEFGSANFAFEVLDELAATNGVDHDYKPDLTFSEEMWLEKLEPYEPDGYNEREQRKESK